MQPVLEQRCRQFIQSPWGRVGHFRFRVLARKTRSPNAHTISGRLIGDLPATIRSRTSKNAADPGYTNRNGQTVIRPTVVCRAQTVPKHLRTPMRVVLTGSMVQNTLGYISAPVSPVPGRQAGNSQSALKNDSSVSTNLDQFGQSSGRGHAFAVKKHSLNMEFNCLVDQFHRFAVVLSRGNATWKVRNVRAVALFRSFQLTRHICSLI